jgi:hypothetical protein
MDEPAPIAWSTTFTLMPTSKSSQKELRGDKILLPQSALEQLLSLSRTSSTPQHHNYTRPDYQSRFASVRPTAPAFQDGPDQLPNPLMFRLVNQNNGNVAYAGIREFSADDGEIGLSSYLLEALGILSGPSNNTISDSQDTEAPTGLMITVHAKHLPKGNYVRLRPLEAGYNPGDWKSLLERQLRDSFTTLTRDSVLCVRGVRGEEFRFLVDKLSPEGEGICVVDTDLEVDIEALNEDQARESLRQIMAKANGSANGSSRGGEIDIWKEVAGQVTPGSYVDYELPSWERSKALLIELTGIDQEHSLDLLVSPKSARQRALPRESEHVFGNFDAAKHGFKHIKISPTNAELDASERMLISVYGSIPSDTSEPVSYTLRVRGVDDSTYPEVPEHKSEDSTEQTGSPEDERCDNCRKWIPKRTMVLHQNFCRRNNISCPKCHSVFQRASIEWDAHWHCEYDAQYGNSVER